MTYTFKAPRRDVNRVFIHCSASDRPEDDDVSVIRKWHTTPDRRDPSKPWRDVGYHYYVRKDGTLQLGRNIEVVPSAQAGHNAHSIAICLGGLREEKFTQAQFDTLKTL
jgi:N-acetylmuramoyl-L-alanine amidase